MLQALKESCEDIDVVRPTTRHEGTQTLVCSLVNRPILFIGHWSDFCSI